MNHNHTSHVLKLVKDQGIIQARDISERGIPHVVLGRLVESGQLIRLARGVYMHSEADITEHHSFIEASLRVPHGVVCLLSALSFHDLSDEVPFEVWMAYERGRTQPKVKELPLRFVSFSPKPFRFGVRKYMLAGVEVPITTPAKTVADCFKFRGQIGLEPCLAALRDYKRHRAGTMDELHEAAKVCRVANVMRPYIEALL